MGALLRFALSVPSISIHCRSRSKPVCAKQFPVLSVDVQSMASGAVLRSSSPMPLIAYRVHSTPLLLPACPFLSFPLPLVRRVSLLRHRCSPPCTSLLSHRCSRLSTSLPQRISSHHINTHLCHRAAELRNSLPRRIDAPQLAAVTAQRDASRFNAIADPCRTHLCSSVASRRAAVRRCSNPSQRRAGRGSAMSLRCFSVPFRSNLGDSMLCRLPSRLFDSHHCRSPCRSGHFRSYHGYAVSQRSMGCLPNSFVSFVCYSKEELLFETAPTPKMLRPQRIFQPRKAYLVLTPALWTHHKSCKKPRHNIRSATVHISNLLHQHRTDTVLNLALPRFDTSFHVSFLS